MINKACEQILKIKNEKSTKTKSLLLEEAKNSDYAFHFNNIMHFLLDSRITTGIASKKLAKISFIPGDIATEHMNMKQVEVLYSLMNYLDNNNTGKDSDIMYVKAILAAIKQRDDFTEDTYVVAKIMITKDVAIGVSTTSYNKVFIDNKIFEVTPQLAHSFSDHYTKMMGKEVAITMKLDGFRCLAFVEPSEENGLTVKLLSRNGTPYSGFKEIEDSCKRFFHTMRYLGVQNIENGIVLDGELLADLNEPAKVIYKATSKICSADKENKTGVTYNVFDIIPLSEYNVQNSTIEYSKRRYILDTVHDYMIARIEGIHTTKYETQYKIKPVQCFYKSHILDEDFMKILSALLDTVTKDNYNEGLMINICDEPYKFSRTNSLLKMKKMKNGDVRIVGFQEGTNKYAGTLGAIEVEFYYLNQRATCKVGSGFTDEDRKNMWEHQDTFINKICQVKYFEVTSNKSGEFGLRFPIFQFIRHDKDTTNVE